MLVDCCSQTTKADLTEGTHETLVGHLLIIAVSGQSPVNGGIWSC
jgi:hypothetical protein